MNKLKINKLHKNLHVYVIKEMLRREEKEELHNKNCIKLLYNFSLSLSLYLLLLIIINFTQTLPNHWIWFATLIEK